MAVHVSHVLRALSRHQTCWTASSVCSKTRVKTCTAQMVFGAQHVGLERSHLSIDLGASRASFKVHLLHRQMVPNARPVDQVISPTQPGLSALPARRCTTTRSGSAMTALCADGALQATSRTRSEHAAARVCRHSHLTDGNARPVRKEVSQRHHCLRPTARTAASSGPSISRGAAKHAWPVLLAKPRTATGPSVTTVMSAMRAMAASVSRVCQEQSRQRTNPIACCVYSKTTARTCTVCMAANV